LTSSFKVSFSSAMRSSQESTLICSTFDCGL
jgi:hypothetical protein